MEYEKKRGSRDGEAEEGRRRAKPRRKRRRWGAGNGKKCGRQKASKKRSEELGKGGRDTSRWETGGKEEGKRTIEESAVATHQTKSVESVQWKQKPREAREGREEKQRGGSDAVSGGTEKKEMARSEERNCGGSIKAEIKSGPTQEQARGQTRRPGRWKRRRRRRKTPTGKRVQAAGVNNTHQPR